MGGVFQEGPRLPTALDVVMGTGNTGKNHLPIRVQHPSSDDTPPLMFWTIFPFSRSKYDGGFLGQDPRHLGVWLCSSAPQRNSWVLHLAKSPKERGSLSRKGGPFGDLEGGRGAVKGCPAEAATLASPSRGLKGMGGKQGDFQPLRVVERLAHFCSAA